MLPNTGYLKWYDLILYARRLYAATACRRRIRPEWSRLRILDESCSKRWRTSAAAGAEMANIDTVGDLNDQICSGSYAAILILVQEAAAGAEDRERLRETIAEKGNVKFVMIAGLLPPEKPRFSHRLSIQLQTHGKSSASDQRWIITYVNREHTPQG